MTAAVFDASRRVEDRAAALVSVCSLIYLKTSSFMEYTNNSSFNGFSKFKLHAGNPEM